MNRKLFLAVVMLTIVLTTALAACDSNEVKNSFESYDITFYNEDSVYHTVKVTTEDFDLQANMPEIPRKEDDAEGSYVFSRWKTQDGKTFETDKLPGSALNVYAEYSFTPHSYTVEFVDYDGSNIPVNGKPTQSVVKGQSAIAPEDPVREGYTFVGWDTSLDNISKRTTIKALYEINRHKLVFADGDKIIASYEDIEFASDVTSYIPLSLKKIGFEFAGWQRTDGKNGNLMPDSDLTFKAQWRIVYPNVTVTPSPVAPVTCVYGEGKEFTIDFDEYEGIQYNIEWFVDGKVQEEKQKTFLTGVLNAGSYSVYAKVTAGAEGCEQVSVQTAPVTLIVEKAQLTVTLNTSDVVYGENAPDVTYTVQGFVNGEDESVLAGKLNFVTDYKPGVAAGLKCKVSAQGLENENYAVRYLDASFTVLKRKITVRPEAAQIVYGDELPETFGFSAQGLASFDDESVLGTPSFKVENYVAGSPCGEYVITFAKQFENGNYDVSYESALLTVNKKDVVLSVNPVGNLTYLDNLPEISFVADGLVAGDGLSSLGTYSYETDYYTGAAAGGYYVRAVVQNDCENYNVTTEEGVYFLVERYSLRIEGKVLFDNTLSHEFWQQEVSGFVKNLPYGHIAQGTLSVTTMESGDYVCSGNSLDPNIVWEVPFSVTKDGEDRTDSFELSWNFTLSLGKYVNVSVSDYSGDYNGEPQGTQVSVEESEQEVVVSYSTDKCVWQQQAPYFTDAGKYTVYYKISVDGEELAIREYNVTINKIYNELDTANVGTYTYNGQKQYVSGVVARHENAAVSYLDNEFVNVPEGGKLTVVAVSEETKNYLSTQISFEVTVNKAEYDSVPELPPYNVFIEPDKTLDKTAAPQYYTWINPQSVVPVLGNQQVDAYYCADERNYNPKKVSVTIVGNKTTIEIDPDVIEINFGETLDVSGKYRLKKDGMPFEYTLSVTADRVQFDMGTTYIVTLTGEDGYYTAKAQAVVKVKSVKIGDGAQLYTIEDALNQPLSGNLIITANTAFAGKDVRDSVLNPYVGKSYYTLKEGGYLLVPYDSQYRTDTDDVTETFAPITKNSAYVTLTVSEGVRFYVENAHVYVAGMRCGGQPSGNTTANYYGALKIESGAEMVIDGVNSVFESLGWTYGEGKITVNAGKIYEPMTLTGYKGGKITKNIYESVFPVNQYAINNITVTTEIYSGVEYYVKAFVYISTIKKKVFTDVKFYGKGNDVFIDQADGKTVKKFDNNTGNVTFEFYGTINMHDIALDLVTIAGIFTITVSTEGKQVPFPGNFSFVVKSGATLNTKSGIKLLPGADFYVEKDATVNVNEGGNVFVYSCDSSIQYDKSQRYNGTTEEEGWQDGGNSVAYPHRATTSLYFSDVALDYNKNTPATFVVEGSVNFNAGSYVAGLITAKQGGVIYVDANANVSNKITEDYTHYDSGAKYFYASNVLLGKVNGNAETPLEKGVTYVGDAEGNWIKQ